MKWLLACVVAAIAIAQSDPAAQWWSHVAFLAADTLEGRQPGAEGHTRAAQYVARQFDTWKLQPAAEGSYFQVVPVAQHQLDETRSLAELIRDGQAEPLVFGRDANLAVRGVSGATVEAGLVFVGHGLRIPEAGIDDLAGLDLKGKIAVVLRGAPKRVPGPLAAHAQSTAEHWGALRKAGAIGVVTLTHPKRADIPWDRTAALRLRPSLVVRDSNLVDTAGQQVSVTLNPASFDRVLKGTNLTAGEIFRLMEEDQPLPRRELAVRLRARAVFTSRDVAAENVAALLPGSDPALSREYIVFTAHLDHIGKGSGTGDVIYNGAMDNAAGVATLLETARALSGRRLRRSILFAAVTGEESGLYGSKYLAAHPVVKRGRVVANLNADMFLPVIPLRAIVALGLEESDLGEEFQAAAKAHGIEVRPDPEPQRNGFIRSDQYSFIRRGIPALALRFWAEPGSPEASVLKQWLAERYHGVRDDLAQPVHREAAAQFNAILATFLERVANRPQAPRWRPTSFFRRYASGN